MANKGKTYYKLQTVPEVAKSYKITKFNSDIEMESSYYMNYMPTRDGGYYDCQCPASKFDCRHKDIMQRIVDSGKVNAEEFFCFETKTFHNMQEI